LKKLFYKGHKGFTLIELIFVILVISLLSALAIISMPDNTLIDDYDIIRQKIINTKSQAIGYKEEGNDSKFCITLTKEYLNNDKDKVKYKIKSDISTNLDSNILCFDYLGRSFEESVDVNLNNMLHKVVEVNISYKNKFKVIKVYPFGGDIE
jgi:prepilin-type N-terminal cleavage/methylation domain-containing protein